MGIIFKRIVVALLAFAWLAASANLAEAASPKPGSSCTAKGKTVTKDSLQYVCQKSGSKLVWSKPRRVVTPSPSATPTLSPSVITSPDANNAESCKLFSTDESAFHFIDNPNKGVVPSTGKQNIYFAFVRFSDYIPQMNPNDWMRKYGSYFKDFYKSNSYGRLELSETHNSSWLTLPGQPSDFGWLTSTEHTYSGHLKAIKFALQAMDPTVDFSKYDSVSVVFGVDPTKYTTGTAAWFSPPENVLSFDGKTFRTAATFVIAFVNDWGENAPRVLAHEIGHTFGMQDLYAYESQGAYSNIHRFVGQFDLMGFVSAKSPSILLWDRWRLGWIDSGDVYCQSTSESAEYLVNDTAALTGPRLVVVKTSNQERIAVEYRPIGTDSQAIGGLVIYRVNTSANGMGSMRVERVSADPLNLTQADYLALGEQKCLPEICITFRGLYGKSAIVGTSAKP